MTPVSASSSSSTKKIPYSFSYCNMAVKILLALYELEDAQRRKFSALGFSKEPRVFISEWLRRARVVTNAPKKVVDEICFDLVDGDFVSLNPPYVSSFPH